jgi:hypothetical protein
MFTIRVTLQIIPQSNLMKQIKRSVVMERYFLRTVTGLILSIILSINLSYAQEVKYNPLPHKKIFKIESGNYFVLDTNLPDVEIIGWDKNEVHVFIAGYEEIKNYLRFDTSFRSNQLKINVFLDYAVLPAPLKDIVYKIKVPLNFNVKIFNEKGGISVNGISGDNNLLTFNGNISINNCRGTFTASALTGNINFHNSEGVFNFSTSDGIITGEDFSGKVSLSTITGNIDLSGHNSEIEAKSYSGNIVLNYSGRNEGIELFSTNGKIILNLPENFNASANLVSLKGKIFYDIPITNSLKLNKTNLGGIINKGGNKLIARTFSGDIEIRKR